jgi:predicted nucleotidyltransferase
MSDIFFNLSGKIDSRTVKVLRAIKETADSLGIPFFIVGASARDFLLTHCFGIETTRMTKDVDLAVGVAGWDKFDEFQKVLTETGRFKPDAREPQRLYFDTVPVDIVPFGPIEKGEHKIAWPPDHAVQMSLFGFKEAYNNSITVRINAKPALDIQLPTLPALAIMKIISWDEKYPERRKDAADILLIMQTYERAGNFDRLYEEEPDLLQEEAFDTIQAGVRLLGRDMATMAEPGTLKIVRTILDQELRTSTPYRLVTDMIQTGYGFKRRFDEVLRQVEKLRQGLAEKL